MNPDPKRKRLLDDVTLEGADFREAMLGATLQAVRRRRHWRQARRTAGGILALALIAFMVRWQTALRPLPETVKAIEHPYRLVQTESLPGNEVVGTQPFVSTVTVPGSSIEIVRTAPASGNFRLLNDEQLLALVSANPAMLVRDGVNSERLIFANPEDEKRLLNQ